MWKTCFLYWLDIQVGFKETQEKAPNGAKQRRDYIKSIYIFIIHQLHVLAGFSYSIQIKLSLFLSLSWQIELQFVSP